MRKVLSPLFLGAPILGLGTLASPHEPPVPREWWLLTGKHAIVLDATLSERARLEVGENPDPPLLSADGTLVAVASTGAYTSHLPLLSNRWEYWPDPGSRSTVTLIRRSTLEPTGRYEVPFRPGRVGFSSDGASLVVLSLGGQVSKNEKKQILPRIAVLDVATGKVRHSVELSSEPTDFWYAAASNRVLVACRGFGKRPPELRVYDVGNGATKSVPLPSPPWRFRSWGDRDTAYLQLEKSLLVVNSAGELVGSPIQAGEERALLAPLGPKRHVLSGQTGKQGRLLLLEAGRVSKTLEVPPIERMVLDLEGSRLYACAKNESLVLDAKDLSEVWRFRLPDNYHDLLLDPSGTRLYVQYGERGSVIDLANRRQTASFGVGRGLLSRFSGERYTYSPPALSFRLPASPPFATPLRTLGLPASGKHVLVFSPASGEITIVETRGYTNLAKAATGDVAYRRFLWQLPGGRHFLSMSDKRIIVFDGDEGKVVAQREFPDSVLSLEPKAGLLFVGNAQGTVAYRLAPFEKAKDFGPEFAVTDRMRKDGDSAASFRPLLNRLVLASGKMVRIYDYDFNLLKELSGLSRPAYLYALGVEEEKEQEEGPEIP